jgi:6-phosphofructokinase 1
VGLLTGGGDCPGLNAVIRAIVRKGERVYGDEMIGFLDAWEGLLERRTIPLSIESMRGTLPRGGTVLGTKRGSPYDTPTGVQDVKATLAELAVDALVVPKTIDNDIVGTDVTFGFNTAVQIATDAIDRLHTTAESHDRVMVVEVMGRHSGWIAAYAGIAGGAAAVVIPEIPFDIDEVCSRIVRRHEGGRFASIIVVAEGAEPVPGTLDVPERAYDKFGHVRLGGISNLIAEELGRRTGFETRVVSLGHIQRGGTPTAYDRVLSTRFGLAAIDLVHAEGWGQMVVARGNDIVPAPLDLMIGKSRPVDLALYRDLEVFFA